MVNKASSNKARLRRHRRVRGKISGTPACPRLNVFRSAKPVSYTHLDVYKRQGPDLPQFSLISLAIHSQFMTDVSTFQYM